MRKRKFKHNPLTLCYVDLPYKVEIEEGEENGQKYFIARNPELGMGIMATGNTPEKAVRELRDARMDLISVLLSKRLPLVLPPRAEGNTIYFDVVFAPMGMAI